MTRKNKLDETGIEETIHEVVPSAEEILLKFEDLTITRSESGIKIVKTLGGISDHTFKMFASGKQRFWCLYRNEDMSVVTDDLNGNRAFQWAGTLDPGLYTLSTGPVVKNFSKHRIPGRGYQISFRV